MPPPIGNCAAWRQIARRARCDDAAAGAYMYVLAYELYSCTRERAIACRGWAWMTIAALLLFCIVIVVGSSPTQLNPCVQT